MPSLESFDRHFLAPVEGRETSLFRRFFPMITLCIGGTFRTNCFFPITIKKETNYAYIPWLFLVMFPFIYNQATAQSIYCNETPLMRFSYPGLYFPRIPCARPSLSSREQQHSKCMHYEFWLNLEIAHGNVFFSLLLGDKRSKWTCPRFEV